METVVYPSGWFEPPDTYAAEPNCRYCAKCSGHLCAYPGHEGDFCSCDVVGEVS